MAPVLFRIPGLGFEVPGYGFAMMIGFLLSIWWATRRAEKSGGSPDVVLDLGFIALLGGVVGARAMYVAHYWDQYSHRGSLLATIFGIIDVRQGGLEVYGGFIVVVLLVLLYLWWTKNSIRWYLDIVAPSAALGMALGRVGCFLNGCCWGGVCDLPWAVQFPFASPAMVQHWTERQPGAGVPEQLIFHADKGLLPDGAAASLLPREVLRLTEADLAAARTKLAKVAELQAKAAKAPEAEKAKLNLEMEAAAAPPLQATQLIATLDRYGLTLDQLHKLAEQHRSLAVHPAQLYSTLTLGLLALLLSSLYWRRSTRDGQVIFTLLLIEPWTRWVLETVRADNPVDVGGFTISQFLAILLSLVGLLGLLLLQKMPARSPRAKLWTPPPPKGAKAAAAQA